MPGDEIPQRKERTARSGHNGLKTRARDVRDCGLKVHLAHDIRRPTRPEDIPKAAGNATIILVVEFDGIIGDEVDHERDKLGRAQVEQAAATPGGDTLDDRQMPIQLGDDVVLDGPHERTRAIEPVFIQPLRAQHGLSRTRVHGEVKRLVLSKTQQLVEPQAPLAQELGTAGRPPCKGSRILPEQEIGRKSLVHRIAR